MRGLALLVALVCNYRVGCDCGRTPVLTPCVEPGDSGSDGHDGGYAGDAGDSGTADGGLGDGGVQLVKLAPVDAGPTTVAVAVSDDDRVLVVAGFGIADGGTRYVLFDVREDGTVPYSLPLVSGSSGTPSVAAGGGAAVACIPTPAGLYIADLATPGSVTASTEPTPDASYSLCRIFAMSDGVQLLELAPLNGSATYARQRTSSGDPFGPPHALLADAGVQVLISGAAAGHACAVASLGFTTWAVDRFSSDAGWSGMPPIPYRATMGGHSLVVQPVPQGCFAWRLEVNGTTTFTDTYLSEADGGWATTTSITPPSFLYYYVADGLGRVWLVDQNSPPGALEYAVGRGWSQTRLAVPGLLSPGILAARPGAALYLQSSSAGLWLVQLADGGSNPPRLIVSGGSQPLARAFATNAGGLYGAVYFYNAASPDPGLYLAVGRAP